MIALVVAYDLNRLIGQNNQLPWHYKEDLKYFKKVTLNQTVLMGRKTYASILKSLNGPLPNRDNVVLSTTLVDDRVTVISDLESYVKTAQTDIYVIGGASIYAQTLPLCDRLYITHIEKTFTGDTFFPAWSSDDFTLMTERQSGELRFAVYERVSV